MPLIIEVGLSRKSTLDYQSAGVSLNLRAELDQSLLARPRDWQGESARQDHEAEGAGPRRSSQ